MYKKLLSTLTLTLLVMYSGAQIIPFNSNWMYLDNGSNQGTAWRATGFNDLAWKTGSAEFGYGDGGEATAILFGSNAKKKFITTYFRKTVAISNPSAFQNFTLLLKRDDGAVVYINGAEVFRSNMPAGGISFTTKASSEPTDDGNTSQTVTLPSSIFINGNNVVAVEIHQSNSNGTDLSFNLQLVGNIAANQLPSANAGIDQSITLPLSNVTLNGSGIDPDGSISTFAWTKLSGPVAGTIGTPSAATTAISGLTIAGTYVYRLTVTDNSGGTATDDINVIVNDNIVITNPVIPYGSPWNYLDNGSDQGTSWRGTSFNDATWKNGPAQLGYGDGDEATVVSYGPSSTAKYITTYFRKSVNFDPSVFTGFTMKMKRDDGIVIYVNGTEVYRDNMPSGTVTNSTLASSAAGDDGTGEITTSVSPSVFTNGINVIAAEIHQNAGSSSDISFDLELRGNSGASITRGPYLQSAGANSITLRWRTDVATDSRAEVGVAFGIYSITATDPAQTTEHEIKISGLSADTKYYYRVGTSTNVIEGTAENFFRTQPPTTTTRKIRVSAFGDCGINTSGNQSGTLSAYRNFVGTEPAEIMLLLGDNAYQNGTDAEYQSGFFNAYSSNILKNHNLFPAPGNHDYANSSARQTDKNIPYYNIFTLPVNGEIGGLASGTESYYSYNWGNIHFLSLDSYGFESANSWRLYDTMSPQVTWIKADLDANKNKWTVAYWHHPPYTMGSHNSDTETELVNMRTNFIRIMERYGVDLILCGHSHNYERSYLLKGHYGNEASFDPALHALSSSSGKYNSTSNSCPYITSTANPEHGTVYVVSGSAGAAGSQQASFPHNALPFSISDGGMFYFEVEDNRLDGKFIRKDGSVYDQFTIMKNVNSTTARNILAGEAVTLTASWVGSYNWSTGQTSRSIVVSPSVSTTYTCVDPQSCISDQFNLSVTVAASPPGFAGEAGMLKLYPVPVKRGQDLYFNNSNQVGKQIDIYTISGSLVKKLKVNSKMVVNTTDFKPGIYVLKYIDNGKAYTMRFVVAD